MLSLVEPLYVVASEQHNPEDVRSFAIKQLRHIAAVIGVRRAALLADAAVASSKDMSSDRCDIGAQHQMSCNGLPALR